MKPDLSIIFSAAEALKVDFGTLDDMPVELKNTLANIYYKYFLLTEKPEVVSQELGFRSLKTKKGIKDSLTIPGLILIDYTHTRELIYDYRDMVSQNKVPADFIWKVAIDTIKYQIRDAFVKSPLTLYIERIFKRPKEIPMLYIPIEEAMSKSLNKYRVKTQI